MGKPGKGTGKMLIFPGTTHAENKTSYLWFSDGIVSVVALLLSVTVWCYVLYLWFYY